MLYKIIFIIGIIILLSILYFTFSRSNVNDPIDVPISENVSDPDPKNDINPGDNCVPNNIDDANGIFAYNDSLICGYNISTPCKSGYKLYADPNGDKLCMPLTFQDWGKNHNKNILTEELISSMNDENIESPYTTITLNWNVENREKDLYIDDLQTKLEASDIIKPHTKNILIWNRKTGNNLLQVINDLEALNYDVFLVPMYLTRKLKYLRKNKYRLTLI